MERTNGKGGKLMGGWRVAVSVVLGTALWTVVVACTRPTPDVVEVVATRAMEVEVTAVAGLPTPDVVEVVATRVVEAEVTAAAELPTPSVVEFITLEAKGGTEKQGELKKSETWSGTILVKGTVVVPKGVTLTIEPKTLVLFQTGQGLTVHGTLKAEGTSEKEPIAFRGVQKEAGCWTDIRIVGKDARASFKFCQVSYGGDRNIWVSDGASAKIVSCEISHARREGIEVDTGGRADIDSNRIHDNGRWGIHARVSPICTIHHNLIYDHRGSSPTKDKDVPNAIHLWENASCNVYNNTLFNSRVGPKRVGWGIELGFQSNPTIENNIIAGFEHGIIVHEVLSKGTTIDKQKHLVVHLEQRKADQKVEKVVEGDRVLRGKRRSVPVILGNLLWDNGQHYSEQVVEGDGKIIDRGKKDDGYKWYKWVQLPLSNCRADPSTAKAQDPKFCDATNKDFRLQNRSPAKGRGAYPEPLSKTDARKAKCK
jgi:hypothetical protein